MAARDQCHEARKLVYASMFVYVIVLSAYTLMKHACFKTYAWDLGIYGQAFWNTVNVGGVFTYNCERHLVESGSFFGVHFSPALFLLLPLYTLRQNVTTLLVAQTLALGLSAYPVYLLARECLGDRLGAALAAAYLLSPALHGVNCYDFHVQALLPLPLNYLMLYTRRGQWVKAAASAVLSLSVMEQASYIVLAFTLGVLMSGVLGGAITGGKVRPRTLAAFTLSLIVITLLWRQGAYQVIHHYNPNVSPYLKAGRHFTVLGAQEPSAIPGQALTHPRRAVEALLYDLDDKAAYLASTLLPHLFLPLTQPLLLISAAPWVAVALLSNYPPYYTPGFQYACYLIPFTQAAATLALSKVRPRAKRQLTAATLAVAALSAFTLSPLSPATDGLNLSPAYRKPRGGPETRALRAALKLVPPGASILTQDDVFPHVCGRRDAYVIPPDTRPDNTTWARAWGQIESLRAEYVLVNLTTDPLGTAEETVRLLEQTGLYEVAMTQGGVRLYRLRATLEP